MRPETARHVATRSSPALRNVAPAPRLSPAARREGRRRRQLIRRRRRDLLQDAGVAVALTVLTLIATAGLGVVALLSLAAGVVLVATLAAERFLS
ncbi:MAG: hypothetical protein ACLP50_35445 [Solirubrobacteraceae bacterium]